MSNTTKIVLGLTGAVAAGVVIGLMLAPEKGSDTRRKVADAANDWATQLSDIFANAKTEVDKLKTKGTRMATDAANRYSKATENYS